MGSTINNMPTLRDFISGAMKQTTSSPSYLFQKPATSSAPVQEDLAKKRLSQKASAVKTGMTGEPEKRILTTEELGGVPKLKKGKILTTEQLTGTPKLIQPTTQKKQKKSGLESVADFFGVKNLAKGLGQTIFLQTKTGKQTLRDLEEGKITPEQFDDIMGMGMEEKGIVRPGQVKGSAAKTLGTVVAAGLPAVKGATPLARIGQASLQGSGIGAISGLGTGLEKDSQDLTKDIFSSAVFGAVLGGAFQGLGEVGKALTEKVPARLYNTAIKTPLDDTRKSIKFNGKTLGDDLIERGVVGTDKKLLDTSFKKIKSSEEQLQNILKNESGTVKRVNLEKYLDDLIAQKKATPGMSDDVVKIKEVLNQFPEELPLVEANKIKRNIYQALRDTSFKIDPSLSTKKEAMKKVALGIKNEIEKESKNKAIKGINKDLSVYLKLNDRMIDKIARQNKNQILGLSDIGVGAIGGIEGGMPSSLLAILGKKTLGSSIVKTGGAVLLDKAKKKTLPQIFKNLAIKKATED